ncbi:MAG: TRAM domain-containing protein [Planctomycetes bacterium]|nr:TRAM domain-containing protein [Planctomycetota bacterium]
MLVFVIRLLFFLAMAAGGYVFGGAVAEGRQLVGMLGYAGTAIVVIVLDVLIRRKNISVISAVFFGLLVGLMVAMLLAPVVDMYDWVNAKVREAIKVGVAAVTSYVAISLILQTKDDFRFIIPYIEFAKQQKGGRPLLLDTSVIIDGRIADIAETRFLDAPMVVPRFILHELQTIADSADKLKRDRGRRGLDILNRLQTMPNVEIRIQDAQPAGDPAEGADEKLVNLAARCSGRIVTTDYNLNKVAKLARVEVINVNDLANALKPAVMPGETLDVTLLKAGQEGGQGVGYLEDGTMVVVEDGQDKIGRTVTITVTNVLQKSAGRMIFGRTEGASPGSKPRGR